MRLLGYNIFSEDLEKIELVEKIVINTINPHSYIIAKKDHKFRQALKSSDILLPDGEGIVLAAKILKGDNISKISGYELHSHILEESNKKGNKIFYLGSSNRTLRALTERVKENYPNIILASYSPPYKNKFNEEENLLMIAEIEKFHPDILFVGMTAPKQEKWVYQNKKNINVKIICSIGAVFDFYSGTIPRVHKLWLDLHLEWLIRLLREPKRMWRRNFISTPLFLIDIFLLKLKTVLNL